MKKLYTFTVKQHATTYKNIAIKTASDLKHWHELLDPSSSYFSRDTMKFFGDTMKNYGIRHHEMYIELYRKKPVKGGLNSSSYFTRKNLKRIFIQQKDSEVAA